jgi:hypothetical protein
MQGRCCSRCDAKNSVGICFPGAAWLAFPDADRIVDTVIDLAEREGWENLRPWKVAERCGVDLTNVLSEFRDIDAVANAWFERALAAMLQPPDPGFQGRPAGERAHAMMMRWFDALPPIGGSPAR